MASFDAAIQFVLDNEGGFQADPNDRGNYDYDENLVGTNWGISARVARDYGYVGPMEDMDRETAIQIYRIGYWPGLEGVQDQAIATKILDARVNAGGNGIMVVQKSVNDLGIPIAIDGGLGPETVNAINRLDPSALMGKIVENLENYYYGLNRPNFISTWINRARKIPTGLAIAGGSAAILVIAALLFYYLSKK